MKRLGAQSKTRRFSLTDKENYVELGKYQPSVVQEIAGKLRKLNGDQGTALNHELRFIEEARTAASGLELRTHLSCMDAAPPCWSFASTAFAVSSSNLSSWARFEQAHDSLQHIERSICVETSIERIDCCRRTITIKWMLEVSGAFKLSTQAFNLAVYYFDRFLIINSKNVAINSNKMQSLAAGCLYLASKVDEVQYPQVEEFCNMTDRSCPVFEILKTEREIVQVLDWKLRLITVDTCLSYLCQMISNKNSERIQCNCKNPQCQIRALGYQAKINDLNISRKISNLQSYSYKLVAQEKKSKAPVQCSLRTYNYYVFCNIQSFDVRVIDLATRILNLSMLDIGWLKFTQSQLAVSVLFLLGNREALRFINIDPENIKQCVNWLKPFGNVILQVENLNERRPDAKFYHKNDLFGGFLSCYRKQKCDVSLDMLRQAQRSSDYISLSSTLSRYETPAHFSMGTIAYRDLGKDQICETPAQIYPMDHDN